MAGLNDKDLLIDIIEGEKGTKFIASLKDDIKKYLNNKDLPNCLSYPLDKETIMELCELKKLTVEQKDYNLPYSKVEKLNIFWKLIIEKSIQCLRFFDTREPFKDNPEKKIVVYGIDNLNKYYKSYTERVINLKSSIMNIVKIKIN